eukprot:gnl/MRDRNA2_/MRDRNA2_97693_c0_seq1.p1 gnl/MRDRNA2_/MRDRNA2_97693_c0~~gnl/MRDRNA2_/MRDRNA2_97693_c0_seq1.p1  ORF type:complete len:442 (+),score=96.35 gnl/MRDRNA2_/MRDRNA2_97693_c0_seq1:50-1327(+)
MATTSGTTMIRDPSQDGFKCKYQENAKNKRKSRSFRLAGASATLEKCSKLCTDDPECITMSMVEKKWCIGCKQYVLTDNHRNAVAFKKVSQEDPIGVEPELPAAPTEAPPEVPTASGAGGENPDPGEMSGAEGVGGQGGVSIGAGTSGGEGPGSSVEGLDSLDIPKASDQETCDKEKARLEQTYVKTYVELSRLKAEYGELANSTACVDNVNSKFSIQKAPIQQAIDELIKAIDQKVKDLQKLRPLLENALASEKLLRKHISRLNEECEQLPATVSDLDKVRDAIHALSACPGLSRVQFVLPKWTGEWVEFQQKCSSMTDEAQDSAMNAACDASVKGSRAAETGEIAQQTVEGIPETNTADIPLMGTCPNCDGDTGSTYASGHARVCWNPGKTLDHSSQNSACAVGRKAVLCVIDRGDIRQIPGM